MAGDRVSPQTKQLADLKRAMRGMLVAVVTAYFILGIGTMVGVYFYSTTQSDFHQGSCKGRLLLRGLLQQSLDAARTAPPEAFRLLSKEQTIRLYEADVAYNDTSDCNDVQIAPPPTIPPFSASQ